MLFPKRSGMMEHWRSYASKHSVKEAFPSEWSDMEAYVKSTNTTLTLLFCVTPEMLHDKLMQMWSGNFGRWPDVLLLNVGFWSVSNGSNVDRINQILAKDGYTGRFTVNTYTRKGVAYDIYGILREVNGRLRIMQRYYRPFVAFRDLIWFGGQRTHDMPSREIQMRTTEDSALPEIRLLNVAIHNMWKRFPLPRIHWMPGYSLTSLPCCRYFDFVHPGFYCNAFMNKWLAATVVSTMQSRV
jgi:hypothetical protein